MRVAGTALPPLVQFAVLSDSYQVVRAGAIGSIGFTTPPVPAVPVPGPTPVPALPVPPPVPEPAPRIFPSLTHAAEPTSIANAQATPPRWPRGNRTGVDFMFTS